MTATSRLASAVDEHFGDRNETGARVAGEQGATVAAAASALADRFAQGGRLLAYGAGACVTDAQHVAVEFVHPVIVGKRALPALDVSATVDRLSSVVRPADAVVGFGPSAGADAVDAAMRVARTAGALTLGLPSGEAAFAFPSRTADDFVHQEMLEILYHTLWESVQVFLEHRAIPGDGGDTGFLYPFLGGEGHDSEHLLAHVADSVREKIAETARLRELVARELSGGIAEAAALMRRASDREGRLIFFGNGGSATDANDWAFDCACPPSPLRRRAALSLSADPAVLTAIANDVGVDAVFVRQLIAHANAGDVAVAISTSGGSPNVVAALEAARRRGLATIALLGADGGDIRRGGLTDIAITVPSDYVPRIQEVHASIYHVIRRLMEDPCLA